MSLCIVYYCPSSGGNHLKNLINLAPEMQGHAGLDLAIYDHPPHGTVHSRRGRNLTADDFHAIIREPDHRWSICGHFGELAPRRDLLLQIPDRRFVIIGIESTVDRWLLEFRQQRLGQQCHSYWLNEEQPYLYDRPMVKEYWRTLASIKIALEHLWNPNIAFHGIVQQLNHFLEISIPYEQARDIHYRWWQSNFYQDEIRTHYAQHLL